MGIIETYASITASLYWISQYKHRAISFDELRELRNMSAYGVSRTIEYGIRNEYIRKCKNGNYRVTKRGVDFIRSQGFLD